MLEKFTDFNEEITKIKAEIAEIDPKYKAALAICLKEKNNDNVPKDR